MKFVFIDVDGVLNHEQWFTSDKYLALSKNIFDPNTQEWEISNFCPQSVALLNQLTDNTGAKLVVSSSWRKSRTLHELNVLFKAVGITGEVIGKTPYLYYATELGYKYSVPRGCEIKAWLELNKEKLGAKITRANYVILDDDSDMLYWQRERYVWIDPYCGLTQNTILKAQHILGNYIPVRPNCAGKGIG